MHTDQSIVMIPIVQGEEDRVGDNTSLGSVEITDLPPSPANSAVDVSFELDISGVLCVSAKHVPSGKLAAVTIANSPYRLTKQKRDAARKELRAIEQRS